MILFIKRRAKRNICYIIITFIITMLFKCVSFASLGKKDFVETEHARDEIHQDVANRRALAVRHRDGVK